MKGLGDKSMLQIFLLADNILLFIHLLLIDKRVVPALWV